MAGPGIICPLGPANQQEAVGIGGQQYGDGRPDKRAAVAILAGLVLGQALAEAE
jgi:hypothetical protein